MGPAGLETKNRAAAVRLRLHSADAVRELSARPIDGNELAATVRSQMSNARTAQSDWSERPLRDRLKILTTLRLKIAADPRSLAIAVERENLAETLAAEILPLLDACRFLETEATRILEEKNVSTRARPMWLWGNSVALRPEPLGVVLIIAPSNYPLMLPGIQALQAIVAGNAVLIKPAVNCSPAVQTLVSMATSAGVPNHLIQVLPESTDAATFAIRDGVDKVFLTGSATTGQTVSRELAESATPSVMELSGCDAVFVLDDADPNLVSDCLLFGLTLNSSQTCMAPRRVFAGDQQADEILRLLRAKLEAKTVGWDQRSAGPPLDPHGGPAIALLADPTPRMAGSQRALELAAAKIHEAISGGAELVAGSLTVGESPELCGVAILDHVTSDMSLAQSDIFAPVLSFIRVDSDVQALHENAKCPYALSATVFGSTARCQKFARRIHAGCVVINDMIVPTADPRVPFGGRRMSGHGMTRGEAGLLEMTQMKAIVVTRRWFKPHLHSPTAADADVLEQLIRLEHSAGPLQSLMAVPKMIKATLEQMKMRRKPRNAPSRPGTGVCHSRTVCHSGAGGNPDSGDGFPAARE